MINYFLDFYLKIIYKSTINKNYFFIIVNILLYYFIL